MLMKRKQLTAPFENNDLGFLADSSTLFQIVRLLISLFSKILKILDIGPIFLP